MRLLILALGLIVTASCANPESNSIGNGRVNEAGAVQILSPNIEQFTAERLANIIGNTASAENVQEISSGSLKNFSQPPEITALDNALVRFGSIPTPNAAAQMHLRERRNDIQGQLIIASNNRCNAYKIYLRRISSNTQFGLGSIATALGGVGALVSGPAANALSGAAAITTGINAEFQRDVLSSVTTAVIIPGIETQRSALLQDVADRRCLSLGSYSLSTALSDVVKYHGACSADVGIAAAGQAISQVRYNSLDVVKSTQDELASKQTHVATAQTGTTPPGKSAVSGNSSGLKAPNPPTETSATGTTGTVNQGQTLNRSQLAGPTLLLGQPVSFHDCPLLDDAGRQLTASSTGVAP